MNHGMETTGNKRVKIDNQEVYGVVLYVIPLSDRWKMVITSKAERFYIDQNGEQSVWQMPRLDDTIGDLKLAYHRLSEIKDLVLCLLGMIRGVRVSNVVSEKVRQLLGVPANNPVIHKGDSSERRGKNLEGTGEKKEFDRRETESSDKRDTNDESDNDDDNENDDEDGEEDAFALGLSDLEDLVSDQEDDFNGDEVDAITKRLPLTETTDPEILEYLQRYDNLANIVETELSRKNVDDVPIVVVIGFLELLEELKIDAFSAYDLEIDEIIENPDYVVRGCHQLSSRIRRFLWDEYCRVRGEMKPEVETTLIGEKELFTADTPEVQFAVSLKEYHIAKLPKFYTDYNRQRTRKAKDDANDTYPELCKQIPLAVRKSLYDKWVHFSKLSEAERKNRVLKVLQKAHGAGIRESLEEIKQKRMFDNFDCFFMDTSELGKLEIEL